MRVIVDEEAVFVGQRHQEVCQGALGEHAQVLLWIALQCLSQRRHAPRFQFNATGYTVACVAEVATAMDRPSSN